MSRLHFTLQAVASGSCARAARFKTLHGEVETPIFMPVGTQATVKSQTVESLKAVGSNILLANTYHLLLRPGPEVLKKLGGIHRFMNWDRPVLTDSGGFQIFSLPHSREMNEEGARFKSYVDNQLILLSPEVSIQTQRAIGSDIMMVLDQCIPSTSSHAQAKAAMELTHRWAKRSLIAREDSPQSMFAIVQGACFEDLRKNSADALALIEVNGKGFDGFAVGGLAVGESKTEREDFTELTASFLPTHLPRYLMGVGTPIDILEAVHRGIDMFDCIIPSQFAQRGIAFTSKGKFQLRRSVYKFSEEKLDSDCICSTCQVYSKAYLHHLVKTEETLGWHLLALHNFTFYHRMMREIRASILENRFLDYYRAKRELLILSDEEFPSTPERLPKTSRAEKNRRLGDYEVHASPKGYSSIRQISSGEIMHSVNPPEEEAQTLYVKPAKLRDRTFHKKSLVIWDVGLGAATNSMAVVNEFLAPDLAASECEKTLVSFEIDLDPLRLALKNPSHFPFLRHGAPHEVLKNKVWRSEEHRFTWNLLEGDFLETFNQAPLPDIIFYDPFSLHTDSKLWTAETFRKLAIYCKSNPFQFMTYSESTAIRALLLAEGFYVGYGPPSGPKATTTLAYNNLDLAKQHAKLLGLEWLSRWERSQTQFPADLPEAERPAFAEKIRNHPQFASPPN
ncbi:MAG: tRNA guanosine(34) transglycosylase Tgt [Bdellovibrionales bacterium]|nr:tRNA guanosine(34) transglycosylase Tgt [Oligoflexia bacterium]